MAPLSYRRHRFPPEIIQLAIWLYLRFTLSYRDVEKLLAGPSEETCPAAPSARCPTGPAVLSGLSAGGKRIRTAGPTLKETSRSELAMRVSARRYRMRLIPERKV
jgi:hypothetical protein